jgi:glycosyltransferase involved in cell wall biosynthesis
MTPRVTWLLPVRDAMPHLPATLASLADQTFRDSEVLAWDNGSRDGSAQMLARWIGTRLPGRVVLDRPCERLGGCLRAMVAEARSPLLARIDGDDLAEPQRLARQVEALERHPDWLGVGSWVQPIDADGRELEAESWQPCDPAAFRWDVFFQNPLPHPTACLRREAVLRAGSYADMGTGQDWDLWLRLALRGPLANLPERLLRYRLHERSVSAARRDDWPEVGRRLAERYAPELFDGVAAEEALALWRWLSPRSAERFRGPAPSPRRVYALARAGERAAGLERHALARLPRCRAQMRTCLRRRPAWLADWLAVQLRIHWRSPLAPGLRSPAPLR